MKKKFQLLTVLLTILFLNSTMVSAQREMEKLNRGILAVNTNSGIYVNWRIPGNEWQGVSYNLYRDGTKLNSSPIDGASNFLDASGNANSSYWVKPIVKGTELAADDTARVRATSYLDVPMRDLEGKYELNDASVGDLDGDGEYEIVVKRLSLDGLESDKYHYLEAYKLDGTFLWAINLGPNLYNKVEVNFLVYDLDGDGKAEIATRTSEGTIDGTGVKIGDTDGDGITNYRYSISAYDYRVDGPDFISVYDGMTGKEIARDNYIEKDPISQWGQPGMNVTQNSHRGTKCMWTIAYLDGKTPAFVISRGIYEKIQLEAWNFRNNKLQKIWLFDTKNYGPEYNGSGNHNLSLADVDNDGRDEVVYASMVVDDDGTGLYSTGLGHGDALHVTDIDPDRPGLEVWQALETSTGALYRDARTGEELIRYRADRDCGRACAGDIDTAHRGLEFWAAIDCPIYAPNGDIVGPNSVPMNFMVWWDGDLLREFLDHDWLGTDAGTGTGTISKYNTDHTVSKLLTAKGTYSNNYTTGTPCLSADIYGDWREEVIWRTTDNKKLRIYSTIIPTEKRIYTLMHDPQYRIAIAWQNNSYNQPPHPGFYLGDGMDSIPPPPMTDAKLLWKSGTSWDAGSSKSWLQKNSSASFTDGDAVLFDISGDNTSPVQISGKVSPSALTVFSPIDYTFDGTGSISGTGGLLKAGSGKLTINTKNDFTGYTAVWDGTLVVNGSLSGSHVNVKRFARIGGKGILGSGLTMEKLSTLTVGETGSADTLKINGQLQELKNVVNQFDLSDDPTGKLKKNDILIVNGNLNLADTITIHISLLDGNLQPGDYSLINYSGTFSSALSNIKIDGIPGIGYKLKNEGNAIVLEVLQLRAASEIIWKGGTENVWDLVTHFNWLKNGVTDWFVPNDVVVFNDEGAANNEIDLLGQLQIGNLNYEASANYILNGKGSMVGSGGIFLNGTGTLEINTSNQFSGATKLNSGTLKIARLVKAGIAGPLGNTTTDAAKLVFDGGTLQITGSGNTDRSITLANGGGTLDMPGSSASQYISGVIAGTGKLTKTGSGTLSLFSANTYSGGTALKGGTIVLATEAANISGLGTGLVTIENGTLSMLDNSGTYTNNCNWNFHIPTGYFANLNLDSRSSLIGKLTGDGTLNIYTPFIRSELLGDWSQFAGTINALTGNSGTLILGNDKGYGKATLNLTNNVTAFYRYAGNRTIEIGALSGSLGSVLGSGGDAKNTITWKIGTNNKNSVFSGIISNVQYQNSGSVAALQKSGDGTLTLTNANIYSGNTTVDGGTLILNNLSGSGTGTGTITVKPGGTLGGTGSVSGKVTIETGAVLSPGDRGIGNFTVENDAVFMPESYLAIDVSSYNKSADILIVNGKLKLDGILYLNDLGSGFSVGDNYKIVHTGSCSGKFSEIIPSAPGYEMVWDTTGFTVTGYISVAKYTRTATEIQKPEIGIYPNPVKDKLYFSNFGNIEKFEITVENMAGKQVIGVTAIVSSKPEISLKSLPPGAYTIVIRAGEQRISKNFIKMK